ERVQICQAIAVRNEYCLTVMAALHDVVREVCDCDTGLTGHPCHPIKFQIDNGFRYERRGKQEFLRALTEYGGQKGTDLFSDKRGQIYFPPDKRGQIYFPPALLAGTLDSAGKINLSPFIGK